MIYYMTYYEEGYYMSDNEKLTLILEFNKGEIYGKN